MRYWGALLIFVGGAGWTQVKYSNEFLKIGVGARAAGLGNAQVSSAEDATAGYWNPAALLAGPDYPQIVLMHSEYFGSVAKYDYGALALPFRGRDQRFAVSFIRLGIDDIPNTLRFYDGQSYDFSRITKFSVADMALYLSYARLVQDTTWQVGGSVKVVHRVLGPFATAWGFGLDVGVLYRRGPLRIGAALYDATSTFNAWTFNTETFEEAFRLTGNEIPQNSIEWTRPSFRLGFRYALWAGRRFSVVPMADVVGFTDGKRNVLLPGRPISIDAAGGLELKYRDIVALRVGASTFQKQQRWDGKSYLSFYPTAGIGFRIWYFGIDYALANFTGFSQGLYSHLISLRVDLAPELRRRLFPSKGGGF
jgi:hypothetical protein